MVVITAFSGLFRAFLGRKVYQMYQLFHLYHGTVQNTKAPLCSRALLDLKLKTKHAYKWLIASLRPTTPSVVLVPISNISAELRS